VAGSGKKWFVVEDGWEQKQFYGIETGSLIFSTDSQSLGYVAEVTNWERILIVDGQEKERYHAGLRRPIRSPNLRRVAYRETDGIPGPDDAVVPGRVVVDGQKSKWYDHGERVTLAFSPDSLRLAYAISGGRKWLVVVDGREGKQYDLIEGASLLFSPDSKHVAYVARRGGKWLVVVNEREGTQYDMIEGGSLVISPDSERLGYVARRGGKWLVVVDGQEGTLYDMIKGGSLVFSADSQRVGYAALNFTRRLGFVVRRRLLVVVDGQEGSPYDSIVAPTKSGGVIFDSPNQLHYIVRKDNAFYLVEERLT